jgi:hypothetical protein
MNRLARERSPYLLQHAANPVDWYAWGNEAFDRARREDKPIFLSIGYSTCHWCHVMEHESFEDPAIAELLNHEFVSIKVDREERPDVDRVYMSFVQATTGSGGWPMTVFLTPELKPFFGGTYFPPSSKWGLTDRRRQNPNSRRPMRSTLRSNSFRGRLIGDAEGSVTPRSFLVPPSCSFFCGNTPAAARTVRDRRPRCRWRPRRFARWRLAGCAITSAAAFTATR